MSKRKSISKEIETEVLTRSGRRCCICFGLGADFEEKAGQIAHLDRDPSNCKIENLAFLCLPHHDQYDSKTSQSKGLTISEVKQYRTQLYEAVAQMRKGVWPIELDVPLLRFSRPIDPIPGMPAKGIQFTDREPTGRDGPPVLYLSVYFKTNRFFGQHLPPLNQKWLYLEANMRFAFNLRIQIRAWNERDVLELMRFLTKDEDKYLPDYLRNVKGELLEQSFRKRESGYDLHGPRPEIGEHLGGDYFYVWREHDENRLIMSTFSPTNAGISIHARFSDEVARAFADYLEQAGFTKPFST